MGWVWWVWGGFGGFHDAAMESPDKKSSRVVATQCNGPVAEPSADVHMSTVVENDIHVEMPVEERSSHVVR